MPGKKYEGWTFLVMTPKGIEAIGISRYYFGKRLTYADAQRIAMAKAQRRYKTQRGKK